MYGPRAELEDMDSMSSPKKHSHGCVSGVILCFIRLSTGVV
ncbi:hypothetical protein PR003_g13255 [Phytophthora rubi]|uniref:Uncharacterized protein n=1 Tax=Phytophthora rubi TaxID=129364 RepID=A0A6A4F6B1_9STRA|nr:hypothetical protein PR003_g13255 [Phytophthora rubi]